MTAMPYAVAAAGSKYVVIVSSPIKPYRLALDGIVDELKDRGEPPPDIQYFNKFAPDKLADLTKIIQQKRPQFCFTIGPQASSYAWKYLPGSAIKKIYTMLAAPDAALQLPPNSPVPLGISLDIPVKLQIQNIKCFLPEAAKIGVLYNPKFSRIVVEKLQQAARNAEIAIIPLKVNNTSEIASVFQRNLHNIDALLFIPDPDVAFESIIRLLIRVGINNKIPAIGFNRFFYNNGAAISIIIDYYRTGRRTVELLLQSNKSALKNNLHVPATPYIVTWPNYQVLKYTSAAKSSPSMCQGIEAGP